jgi:hypothetical protein
MPKLLFYRQDGGRSAQDNAKGMLDTLDDAFWMLIFSSKKQSQIIRQQNDLSDDD